MDCCFALKKESLCTERWGVCSLGGGGGGGGSYACVPVGFGSHRQSACKSTVADSGAALHGGAGSALPGDRSRSRLRVLWPKPIWARYPPTASNNR